MGERKRKIQLHKAKKRAGGDKETRNRKEKREEEAKEENEITK